jgi:hypothetical protein
MDRLTDILGSKDFTEPPESSAIKNYILTRFDTTVNVMVRERDIIIDVPSAALANTLHLRSPEIKELSKTDKRLIFRII